MPTRTETFDDVLRQVADVDGWMTDSQAQRLWNAARRVGDGETIVEIGSFRGRSLIVLARAAADGTEIVSIEPHAGNDRGPQEIHGYEDEAAVDHDVYNANLRAAGVAERVRHVRKFSHDALDDVNGRVGLLYIDGAHRFGPARADIVEWGAKVDENGEMLIHDSFSSVGVTGAIAATLLFGKHFRYVGRSGSLAHYRRDEMSGRDRLANAARQAAQLPWFVRNVAIKALIVAHLGRLTPLLGHRSQDWPY